MMKTFRTEFYRKELCKIVSGRLSWDSVADALINAAIDNCGNPEPADACSKQAVSLEKVSGNAGSYYVVTATVEETVNDEGFPEYDWTSELLETEFDSDCFGYGEPVRKHEVFWDAYFRGGLTFNSNGTIFDRMSVTAERLTDGELITINAEVPIRIKDIANPDKEPCDWFLTDEATENIFDLLKEQILEQAEEEGILEEQLDFPEIDGILDEGW